MSRYQAATKEITTKLEILKSDFQFRNGRSSIESIQTRIKKPASILKKLRGRGIEVNLDTIRSQLDDVAGIRVICPFIDDIYLVAEKLREQDDIRVIRTKDYIRNPKPNGYRSYHMIVEVPVFFMDAKEQMRAEIQLRWPYLPAARSARPASGRKSPRRAAFPASGSPVPAEPSCRFLPSWR